jgi:hypothetical protein
MESKIIEELINKYNEGVADPSEIKLIEQMIATGELDFARLMPLNSLHERIQAMPEPAPSLRLDDQFYSALASEKKLQQKRSFSISLPEWSILFPRLASAAVLLIAGFAGGYFFQRPAASNEVHELTQQVSDLREMMMLSLLEKESATERLKAVSLTSEMGSVSEKVTKALFQTLNQDENVNVRLAALEALKPYVKESKVRQELIRSISRQNSPLVQVAMAELMASIQEKKSVKELQKILDDQNTPKEIKSKIKESIDVLI